MAEKRIKLPCGHTVAEAWLLSEGLRIMRGRRVNPGGAREGAGRPKKLVTCERCGYEDGVAAMRRHRCAEKRRGA